MLFRNTFAQSTPTVIGYIFSFVLAPLMLSRLGLAAYGIWAVTGSLATYAWLMDLGLRRSLSRFVALYHAGGDPRGIKECLGLGLIVMTAVGLLIMGIAVAAAPFLSRTLGVLSVEDMRVVLLCSGGIAMCYGYMSVIASVSTGLRRMVPPNVAQLVAMVINFAFSIGALLLSTRLVDYALANLIAAALALVPSMAAQFYVWRSFPVALPSLARAREIVGFGLKAQVHWLSDIVNQQTDRIIIAFLIGPAAAAAYDIAARVVLAVKAVALLTISAMVPTATAHIVERGREAIPNWYRHYTRRVVALAFPLFVVAMVASPFLLVAWLGQIPGEGPLIIVGLGFAFFFAVTTEVGRTTAVADGKPGLVAVNSSLTAAINLAFTLALTPLLGLWGVLIGTFMAIAGGALIFVVRFQREYGIRWAEYPRIVGPPALLSLGLAIPFLPFHLFGSELLARRASAAPAAALIVGLYGLLYWIIASRLDYLPERLNLRRLTRRAHARAGAAGAP